MRYLLIGLVLSCFLVSCNEGPASKFEKDGIRITCPGGWHISEQEKVDNDGYYLAIEKKGLTSSGLIAITWIREQDLDLKYWLEESKAELKNDPTFNKSDLRFGKIVPDQFNHIKALSLSYQVSVLGVEHKGIMYAFRSKGKSVHILKQEAVEDTNSNEEGFEIIEHSFTMN
jgi:hypothetical protein